MEKKEFMAYIKAGAENTKRTSGTADWEAAIATAAASGRSYTVTQVHEDLVEGAVSRGRVSGKLKDLFSKKQVARIVTKYGYQYHFDPEVIAAQHSEE